MDLLSQTFGLTVDGEAYPGVSIRGPRFIYKEFGDSGKTFDTAIQPGETRDGYICMEVPADFQSLRITYFPRAGFWTGTRHSSLTSIVRTWKLHRSRWKHSSKSLPANGLCAVLPQIQKQTAGRYKCLPFFLHRTKAIPHKVYRSVLHAIPEKLKCLSDASCCLAKKFSFSELTLDFCRTFWYNPV